MICNVDPVFPAIRFPCYRSTLDRQVARERLGRLLVPGKIDDDLLRSSITRLHASFSSYARLLPFGLWSHGLAVTPEMRSYTETRLPLREVRRPFLRLVALSMNAPPFLESPILRLPAGWLDLLRDLPRDLSDPNPARILRHLMDDEEMRIRFLFSIFLPGRYGGGFSRYPIQQALIRSWLGDRDRSGPLRCLDAACGSGEGSYELASALKETGHPHGSFTVYGITADPLEVFAAAHGFFPHDPTRQKLFDSFRNRLGEQFCRRISFCAGNLLEDSPLDGPKFRLIMCNGYIGGPFLSNLEMIGRVVGRLVSLLQPGGLLVAADRFHEGWKKKTPPETLREILRSRGLEPLPVGEGVAGMKKGARE